MPAPQSDQGVAATKTLIERAFRSVNLSTSPTAMEDGECPQLENLMPFAPGNLVVTPGAIVRMTSPVAIARFWMFSFATTLYYIVQGTDGSILITSNGTWTTLAAAGATTVNGLHMTRWNGADAQGNPDAVLWVDTVKGYGNLTPTAFNVLQAGITGQCLTVYAGRVWIGSATEVVYSAPDAYNDFLAIDYAGSFRINDPSFTGNVIALQATQGYLYIIGAGMMALNNVQVQSVAGSTTLVTTYYLQPVSSLVSIANEQAAMVLDNVLFVASSGALWAYYGLNGQPVSQTMGSNFSGDQFLFATQLFGKSLIVTSAGYVYMLNERQWFTMLADAKTWTGYATVSLPIQYISASVAVAGYVTDGTNILQLGGDVTSPRTCALVTKLYDVGNASINKQVLKTGIELWPNNLLETPITSLSISLSLQLLGYVAKSETVNMVQSLENLLAVNLFLPTTINLLDRYFSLSAKLTAQPGLSIGACLFEFRDSTAWPNRNINVVTTPALTQPIAQSPVTVYGGGY